MEISNLQPNFNWYLKKAINYKLQYIIGQHVIFVTTSCLKMSVSALHLDLVHCHGGLIGGKTSGPGRREQRDMHAQLNGDERRKESHRGCVVSANV